jgi:integrase
LRGAVDDLWVKRDGTPSARYGRGRRWRARVVGSDGRCSRAFARKSDALNWVAEQTARWVRGEPLAGRATPTLREFYDQWAAARIWAPSTRDASALALRSAPFAERPLSALGRADLQQWIAATHARGLAPSTIATRLKYVRTVLRAAGAEGHLQPDALLRGLSRPRVGPSGAWTLPSPEQVGAILRCCDPQLRALAACMAFAGLRPAEALGLRGEDIDRVARQITVERQIQWKQGGPSAVAPKHGSHRTVPVSAELLAMLPRRDGWLFTGPRDGRPLRPEDVRRRWHQAAAAAGVARCRVHVLRHFYASGLIAAGCDVVAVQRALGHSSAAITLGVYSHLWPSGADRTRAAAGALLASTLHGSTAQ